MIRLLISLTLVALLAACGQQNANLDERLSVLTAQIIQNPGAAENANRQKEIMDILDKLGGEQYINEVAEHVFNDTTGIIDEARAKQYIAACEAFALIHKGTDKGADYLYKATETLRALRQPEKCLAIYDQLIMDYPEHRRAAQALFLKGFTYDNDLGDYENARKYYEEFLAKYPNDDFASSAQFLLENLGKSDDELLQVLQSKHDSLSKHDSPGKQDLPGKHDSRK